ncbi:protein moonraker isoform X2 [Macrotis lagotis]|uniref:protein moonraker isoform X2 n=1 Tax=Macrotis lagotis TaxID=92651 RepID=UPI003D68C4E5
MGPSAPPTQLRFSRKVPASPDQLAVRYSGPRPIVIEKLRPPGRASPPRPAEPPGPPRAPGRPGPFAVLSEEKLLLAVQLAKRDVKRGQPGGPAGAAPRAQVRLLPGPGPGSPPTRDPGPRPLPARSQSLPELRRLRRELSTCLQRMEGLAPQDRPEGGLDPKEAERSRVRQQEQAVRTARVLYALQQQVKEIQEELDKFSPCRIKHTKKSRAMSRLAAAHRGAIRALQMFVNQFPDSGEPAVSERYRELGSLIRQLSLCSARLDTDPSVPDVVLDLLQQIEELDSLLERKQSLGKLKKAFPGVGRQSPPNFPVAMERSFSMSPVRERKPPVAKEKLPQEGRRPNGRKPLEVSPLRQLLGEGLEDQPATDLASSDQNTAIKGGPKAVKKRPLSAPRTLQRRGIETAAQSQQGFHKADRLRPCPARGKDCGRFQRTTVSFRLKKSHPPMRDQRIPWIPPNPTSPPASPKCVTWGKVIAGPKDARREASLQQEEAQEERPCRAPIEHEALRLAWLDAESARRMKELDELKAQELTNIQRLSASTTQLVDKVEKEVLERLKPLLDQVKEVSSLENDAHLGDDPSEQKAVAQAPEKSIHSPSWCPALLHSLGNLLLLQENTSSSEAPHREELPDHFPEDGTCTQVSQSKAVAFQEEGDPILWSMMQRMEEIEQYQEAVRQRFSQMVYADFDFGTVRGRSNTKGPAVDERPRPPRPIQLTRRAASREPQVNILLEKPLDEKDFDESMDMEERGEKKVPLGPMSTADPQQPEGSIFLSVLPEMLQNLSDYQDSYQQYLRTISHESIGAFNPWIIVESLAEQLVEEALEDVTAELQDMCEDYAEAVFTSEFLEPSK